jgi:hypothetical protein
LGLAAFLGMAVCDNSKTQSEASRQIVVYNTRMDNRKYLLDLLEKYKAFDELEEQSQQRIITFVKTHKKCFENNFHLGHITGSAFVVDRDQRHTLLTHHSKLNRWFQFGGHSDGHFNPLEVGWREAQEESGLASLEYIKGHEGIFDVDVHPIPARGEMPEHFHYDIRILLTADKNESYIVSEESKDLHWVPLDEVKMYNDEPAFLRMVKKVTLLATKH